MEENFYSSYIPTLRDKLLKELKKSGLAIKVLNWDVRRISTFTSPVPWLLLREMSISGASNHNLKFPHCLSNNVSVPSLVNRTEQRACFDFNFSPSLFHCFVQTCRITELVRLEGTSGDDLLHSPCFDELHEILVCPFLQPVEVSLNGIITSWCINQPFQLVCLANLLRVHCTPSSTSLMKRLNSTGPCIDL
ncbi:uncharacterized protein LOC110362235 isoform X3 [Columba livia]|uniref:uncharacterized protein LOC110362235 isoform X3 n=1 Tax=Columba livia TaxID=8932 RepID=UPI0031BB75A4